MKQQLEIVKKRKILSVYRQHKCGKLQETEHLERYLSPILSQDFLFFRRFFGPGMHESIDILSPSNRKTFSQSCQHSLAEKGQPK